MTPTQQTGFRKLATFWLDNLPPINLWSLQELRINPFAAPYRLSPTNPPEKEQKP
jgi:hypothetical protein